VSPEVFGKVKMKRMGEGKGKRERRKEGGKRTITMIIIHRRGGITKREMIRGMIPLNFEKTIKTKENKIKR
jgi:hypothetical protein